jgi:protein arginine kinase activator
VLACAHAGPYTDPVEKCDNCDNEATVHEVNVEDGKPVERHLCEACAREAGLVASAPMPVADILQKIAEGQTDPKSPGKPGAVCPACATTFAEFKKSGRLGCPECYKALEESLVPILDRAHQGAVHHVGKVPKRMMQAVGAPGEPPDREAAIAAAEARAEQIRRLRDDLDRAIKSEAYERAAQLRDRLQQLQRGAEPAGDPA